MAAYNDLFLQMLGRNPTSAESSFLDRLINKGELTPGEIGFVIQGLPEAQSRRLETQTGQLENRLKAGEQGAIEDTLNRAIPQANAKFAALGRQGSSGVEAMTAQAIGQQAQNLAMRRQDALLSFYGGGLNNVSQMYTQLSQDARNSGLTRELFNRQADLNTEMFYRNKNANEDARNAAKRGSLGSMIGNLAGTAIGTGIGLGFNPFGMVSPQVAGKGLTEGTKNAGMAAQAPNLEYQKYAEQMRQNRIQNAYMGAQLFGNMGQNIGGYAGYY